MIRPQDFIHRLGKIKEKTKVEPRLKTTSVLGPLFFGPAKRPYIFSEKPSLIRSLADNPANDHILKSQTVNRL